MTGIYNTINRKAQEHFECAQAHPKYGMLIAAALRAFWLVALLLRWKWAYHWTFNDKLWFFDDCKPVTRRRTLILLVSISFTASSFALMFHLGFIHCDAMTITP